MSAPAAASRPLQLLAIALGVAIAALFAAWVRLEPPAPPTAVPAAPTHDNTATPAPASVHRVAEATRETPSVVAPTNEAANPTASAAVLFGTVKRADGTPVSGGYLWLYREGKQRGTANLQRGTFAFSGLQPGTHRLTSRIPDELAIDREIRVQAPQTRLDIELAAKWLLTVNATTPDGKPVREAMPGFGAFGLRSLRALAFPQPLAGDLVSSASSEFEAGLGPFRANDPMFGRDGAKLLPKETLGVLTLPPDKPVHVALLLGGTLITQQPVSPGQEKVDFVLAPDALLAKTGTLTLRCVDPNGAPVVGARVSIGGGGGMSLGEKALTDAEGRYTQKNVLPGRIELSVWHKELRMPQLQAELAPGGTVDLGDQTMRPGVDFEISFAGSGGTGSAYARWIDAPRDARWTAKEQYFSEQNGVAAKASLFPGHYALFVRGKNGVALLEIDTNALPPQPLRVPWAPGASLRIDNKVGTGFVQLEIATARGLPVHRTELGSRAGYDVQLPPGDYVATIRGGGGVTKKTIALPASGAVLTVP